SASSAASSSGSAPSAAAASATTACTVAAGLPGADPPNRVGSTRTGVVEKCMDTTLWSVGREGSLMQMVLVLSVAVLSPGLGLLLLLWLAHLEDTLPRDVEAARRQPAPAPILAIPVT